jgi:Winged helix DNA-binding domain
LNRLDIARWRMRNQRLAGERWTTADEVVGWLGAVQSQDYGPAQWSVAQRSRGLSEFDLERAFNVGAIVRTHVLRPTWHFVRPADIRWMLELTRPRVHAMSAYGERREELDRAVFNQSFDGLARALQGGRHLTRPEIAACLQQAGVVAQAGRLGHILMRAELEGLICSGARRGKQHTYALLDERVPAARAMSREEALIELTVRYFTSHGPASARDFHWWSSLSMADVRHAIGTAGSLLDSEVVDGVTYWFAGSAPANMATTQQAHLLHMFDEYVVGYSETRRAFDTAGIGGSLFQTINERQGVLTLDSQVRGTWRRTLSRDEVLVQARLYTPLGSAELGQLQAQTDRFGAFVGLPARLQVNGR